MDSYPCFSNIIAGKLTIMIYQSFDINSMSYGLHQHQAILEINCGTAHQFTCDQVVFIHNTDIEPAVFLQQGMVTLFKWLFQQFRRMNPVSFKKVEPENVSFSLPSTSGNLLVAKSFQNLNQVSVLIRPGYHEIDIFGRWFHLKQGHCRSTASNEVNLLFQETVPLLHDIKQGLFIDPVFHINVSINPTDKLKFPL